MNEKQLLTLTAAIVAAGMWADPNDYTDSVRGCASAYKDILEDSVKMAGELLRKIEDLYDR